MSTWVVTLELCYDNEDLLNWPESNSPHNCCLRAVETGCNFCLRERKYIFVHYNRQIRMCFMTDVNTDVVVKEIHNADL